MIYNLINIIINEINNYIKSYFIKITFPFDNVILVDIVSRFDECNKVIRYLIIS